MSTIIVTVVGVFVLEKNAQTALLFAGIAFLAVLIEINFAKEDLKNIPGDSVWWFFPHSWYAAKGLFLLFFLCSIVCYSTLGNRNQKTLGAMIALLGVVVLVGWYTEAEWITNTKNKTKLYAFVNYLIAVLLLIPTLALFQESRKPALILRG